MEPWKFYGRQRESVALDVFMEPYGFDALIVRGRRYVGKSRFVRNFFRTRDYGAPVVIHHLTSDMTPDMFLETLKRMVRKVDPSLLEGFVPEMDDVTEYPQLVRHLLRRGCTVAIDEFQRVARTWSGGGPEYLQGEFQHMIDGFWHGDDGEGEFPDSRPRLIVMGSEQQKLMEMFHHPESPLSNRISEEIHVRPFDFDEIAEMARDQGWDARPDRLLTLWSAYGGMPDHWRRFRRKGGRLADFTRDVPEQEWKDGFLEIEETYRNTKYGSFEKKMEIELKPPDRRIVAWLAEKPGGHVLADLPEDLVRDLARAYRAEPPVGSGTNREMESAEAPRSPTISTDTGRTAFPEDGSADVPLTEEDWWDARAYLDRTVRKKLSGKHLGLIGNRSAVDGGKTERWHVTDRHAVFQLRALEAVNLDSKDLDIHTLNLMRREAMEELEGGGLETLAFIALKHLFRKRADRMAFTANVWRRKPVTAEFDILVRDRSGAKIAWIGCCKRNPSGHVPKTDIAGLERLLDDGDIGVFGEVRDFRKRMVSVSPSFTKKVTEGLATKVADAMAGTDLDVEWYVLDIRDMLEDRRPRPLPLPEPGSGNEPPEPEVKDSEVDDGTDFGMQDRMSEEKPVKKCSGRSGFQSVKQARSRNS